MALARGSACPSPMAPGGHTVRGMHGGFRARTLRSSCGEPGLGPAFLAESMGFPGMAWTWGFPPQGEVAFRPLHAPPPAAWHPESELTLGPSSPQSGLALIQLSPLHAIGLPRLSRPQGAERGEPLASRLGLPERAPQTCSCAKRAV